MKSECEICKSSIHSDSDLCASCLVKTVSTDILISAFHSMEFEKLSKKQKMIRNEAMNYIFDELVWRGENLAAQR